MPHLGSESCITEMGMPQPEKGHVFGNKLPVNALPNLQCLLNQLHMSRGMLPCQVLRVPHCCFWCIVGPVLHIWLPPFKPIYFPRCHNLNLFSVCPCNELFVGISFSYITVTFEMSLWSFLFSLSNIFSRTRENGTKIQVVTSAWGIC